MNRILAARRAETLPAAGLVILSLLATIARAAGVPADDSRSRDQEIQALVERLGSLQYREREAAAAALAAAGPDAIDPLLAAAEQSDDLEIAMRARWLVDVLPLVSRGDPDEVATLLSSYRKQPVEERIKTMHRLLRLDADIGIEPLARLVRIERSPEAARVAAALLAREYRAGDPFFPEIARRVLRGLGGSTRPVAVFLRGVAAVAVDPEPDGGILAESTNALARLGHGRSEPVGEADPADDGTSGSKIAATTQKIFERSHVEVLLGLGRRDEAIALTRSMLQGALTAGDDDAVAAEIAAVLSWAADRGTAEVVHWLLDTHGDRVGASLLATYAAATALAACDDVARSESTAASARRLEPDDMNKHLQAAMSLARWGRSEWARREYEGILADGRTQPLIFGLTSILYSEYLHDLGMEREAAGCLRRLLEEAREGKPSGEDILRQLERDPNASRSRMFFFDSCAAAADGDAASARRLVEQSLDAMPSDVDALIALYKLPGASAEQTAEAVRLIAEAAEEIEQEIGADPTAANTRNEYAWLVANTEGDTAKAVRYSKESLDISFDNSSYLDTLAHCQASAGRIDLAVRTQSLALRHEPHGRTIRRNLERFMRLQEESRHERESSR